MFVPKWSLRWLVLCSLSSFRDAFSSGIIMMMMGNDSKHLSGAVNSTLSVILHKLLYDVLILFHSHFMQTACLYLCTTGQKFKTVPVCVGVSKNWIVMSISHQLGRKEVPALMTDQLCGLLGHYTLWSPSDSTPVTGWSRRHPTTTLRALTANILSLCIWFGKVMRQKLPVSQYVLFIN